MYYCYSCPKKSDCLTVFNLKKLLWRMNLILHQPKITSKTGRYIRKHSSSRYISYRMKNIFNHKCFIHCELHNKYYHLSMLMLRWNFTNTCTCLVGRDSNGPESRQSKIADSRQYISEYETRHNGTILVK